MELRFCEKQPLPWLHAVLRNNPLLQHVCSDFTLFNHTLYSKLLSSISHQNQCRKSLHQSPQLSCSWYTPRILSCLSHDHKVSHLARWETWHQVQAFWLSLIHAAEPLCFFLFFLRSKEINAIIFLSIHSSAACYVSHIGKATLAQRCHHSRQASFVVIIPREGVAQDSGPETAFNAATWPSEGSYSSL